MTTRLERRVEIARPRDEVFRFVADPHNDAKWCPRVRSCEQREGDGPGAGATYEVMHNPTFQRPHRRLIEFAGFDPPARVVTRQTDKVGAFKITYLLEPTERGTRLTQLDEIDWRIAPPFRPIGTMLVRAHMGDQLRRLKRLLEAAPEPAGSGVSA